jgi:hypothetical protein
MLLAILPTFMEECNEFLAQNKKNENNRGNTHEGGEEKRIATTVPSTATANLRKRPFLRKYKNSSD